MWQGMMSPKVKKSVGFLADSVHTDNIHIEVTEVLNGFATVVVHFNHECNYNGKQYHPDSNNIGYVYEYEVTPGTDEVEALKDLENLTHAELMAVLETVPQGLDNKFSI